MKKKVYYVIEKETEDFNGIEECTGNRTVTTYTVENGEIKEWFNVETTNEDNSIEHIIDYLVDNGHTEESESAMYEPYYDEFEFIQL